MNQRAALIPAAGFSSRMGSDKALLKMADGSTFAASLAEGYLRMGCNPVVLVIRPGIEIPDLNAEKVTIVRNPAPELGRSRSIRMGLEKLPGHRACYIHNIDNPYLSADLLQLLSSHGDENSWCVPVYDQKGGHPVLLGRKIVETLKSIPEIGDLRSILKNFNKIAVPFSNSNILLNINTIDDYHLLLKMEFDSPGFFS